MDRDGSGRCAETEQPCRALVPTTEPCDEPVRRVSGGRPMAVFLAQLMVDGDPALRPARIERTRTAAALYAQTAKRRA